MDSFLGLCLLLAVFYLLALPIMVFVAFSKINQLTMELRQLAAKVKQLTAGSIEPQILTQAPVEHPEQHPLQADVNVSPQQTQIMISQEDEKPASFNANTPRLVLVPSQPSSFELWIKKAFNWFINDNPLAKVGILVLFFGIGYLIKYSIDNAVLPVEFRLFSGVVISIGLLIVGWRLRQKNNTFSLILQGGSIGSLYILILGAFRFFELLPASLSFILLCIVCFCCIVLALLQNARSLAVMALFGGFAAPILVSTGSGNYIALFSFYLLLSIVAVILAIKKLWRELFYIAFVMTGVVAYIWGLSEYLEQDYLPSQLFILANLLLFGFIYPLWLNRRIALDYVALLSAPCVAFAMQYSIVTDQFSCAIAALLLSGIYLGLVYLSIREQFVFMAKWDKMLRLCLLLLGVSFLSLAIPLALSAQWTAFFWSLEGLIVLHIGLTQKERYFQIAALGLLLFSILSAIFAFYDRPETILGYCITMAVLSICWMASAYDWKILAREQFSPTFYRQVEWGLLGASIVIWLITIFNLEYYFVSLNFIDAFALSLALVLFSIACWWLFSYRLKWRELSYSCLLLWPVILLAMLSPFLFSKSILDFGWYSILWLVAFAMAWGVLRYSSLTDHSAWHLSLYWLSVCFIALNTIDFISECFAYYYWLYVNTLATVVFIVVMSVAILLPLYAQMRNYWPVALKPKTYTFSAVIPLVVILCLAMFYSLHFSGKDISGSFVKLPYVPLVNIVDISLALGLLTLVFWLQHQQRNLMLYISRDKIVVIFLLLAAVFLNVVIIRAVAFYGSINWSLDELLRSDIIQFTLTFIWIVLAVVIMLWANKQQQRRAWLLGISIIAVIVIKLFLIDSAQTSGIIRAAIFIAVALLILVISYYAPVPPKENNKESVNESHS